MARLPIVRCSPRVQRHVSGRCFISRATPGLAAPRVPTLRHPRLRPELDLKSPRRPGTAEHEDGPCILHDEEVVAVSAHEGRAPVQVHPTAEAVPYLVSRPTRTALRLHVTSDRTQTWAAEELWQVPTS